MRCALEVESEGLCCGQNKAEGPGRVLGGLEPESPPHVPVGIRLRVVVIVFITVVRVLLAAGILGFCAM